MSDNSVLAIIPARGGSKGIPRKNVRFMAGKPLIRYSIENALNSNYIDTVIVSTDDEEIAHIAEISGCRVIHRPEEFAQDHVPLDPVINHAVSQIESQQNSSFNVIVTLQPTSPLLTPKTIDRAISQFLNSTSDTLLSVVDDRHLCWTKENDGYVPTYEKRVNRQFLPPNYKETGGIMITRRQFVTDTSRFGPNIDLVEIDVKEAVDIDSHMDWWIAEKLINRKKIIFRADGYKSIGLGHIYRTLMLAGRLIDHDVLFVSKEEHSLGTDMIENSFYPLRVFSSDEQFETIIDEFEPDIIINDILDTDTSYIEALKEKGIFVVNFEDMGDGARIAHLVVNALYEKKFPLDTYFWGKDYYCLREEFLLLPPKKITPEVNNILITFGGTDSHNYTERILKIIDSLALENTLVTIVTGLGYNNMDSLEIAAQSVDTNVEIISDTRTISKFMHQADIIFTSAGRTVFEVASMGTPIIVLAQNNRELHHTFARTDNGIINLGLGYETSDEEITQTLESLINNIELREKCHHLMLQNNLKSGMENVLNLIFSKYDEFKENPK